MSSLAFSRVAGQEFVPELGDRIKSFDNKEMQSYHESNDHYGLRYAIGITGC